ncbi:EAL domain-containing protein [Clostridium botulinum]|nr:EAL domain-containing protein [Clostridium botulinum]NFR15646.1 EAL domain-containing protein [Clostridium botulinum]NFR44654.1 EAL domain-containing protein [Clostridium botulinum]NFS51723.1 EAL domain-containing protein [Clostridium botulinum]
MSKLKDKITSLLQSLMNKFLIKFFYNSNLCGLATIIFNNSFEISYANLEFFKILGLKKDIFNKDYKNDLLSIISKEDIDLFKNIFVTKHNVGDNIKIEFRINKNDANFSWLLLMGRCVSNKNCNCQFICILNDITENKNTQQKLEIETLKLKIQLDPLTKLYNKTASKVLIEDFLKNNTLTSHALMIIDIDNFKFINDNLGHIFGDNILLKVSDTLKSCFDKDDIVGRVGGDEFIVFFKNIINNEMISTKAYTVCNSIKKIYINEKHSISCSIGISISPVDGVNYYDLFEKSDHALYLAKRYGKDCFEIYDKNKIDVFKESDIFNFHSKNNLYNRYNNTFKNKLISYSFDILSESKDIDDAIVLILSKIGEYFNLSRISILEYSLDDINFNITHEWCNYETPCYKNELQNLLLNDWLYYFSSFNENDVFICNDYSSTLNLPEKNKKLYDKLNVKSFLQCLIRDNEQYKGCINFYNSSEKHFWTANEIKLFTTITKIITSYLLKIRNTQRLEKEKLLFESISKNQNIYTYLLKDSSYKLLYMSPNLKSIFPNAKCGDVCYKAFFNSDIPCMHCPLSKLNKDNTTNTVEFFNPILETWISMTASKIKLPENVEANLMYFSDITNFLDRIISKDALTGLMTLPKFEVMANELLNKSSNKYALIYSDFDKFKYINETAGYAIGNKVLVKFSYLLSTLLDTDELVCRASADNFLTLIKYTDIEALKNRLINFNNEILKFQKEEFNHIKLSIISGIYLITNVNDNLFSMIDKANVARKTIKGSHKSQFSFYDSKLHIKATEEKKIENRMIDALDNREFVIYLQPKIQLSTKKLVGAEALVRWITPDNVIFYPGKFIPLFEKNGFIVELDFYVYEEVFKVLRNWMNNKKRLLPISMNVSRAHINNDTFISRLITLINQYGIPINLIELELTENIFLDNIKEVLSKITELKNLGFTFSMDDFGSGYSSLNLLKELPIDVLKLDKSFFPNNSVSSKEKIIVANIVKMAKDLNISVLSEGVETKNQVDFLTQIGCDMVQGYFFSKPIPIDEFEKKFNN